MFEELWSLHERPEPFSRYTADVLWTDPHISQQMLKHHLDPESDLSSRRPESIDKMVEWIHARVDLADKAVCDLGCGPGLYSTRMARRGARVTGVDFSIRSIEYARNAAQQEGITADYVHANYLEDELPQNQDLVCLIYGDLCALSPEQRRLLFGKVKAALKPGGHFVFDVFSIPQYEQRKEVVTYGQRLLDGFWAEGDYFGFLNTFLYDDLKLALDCYLIIEPERVREVFNWLQYFDPDGITAELTACGFDVLDVVDAITGKPWRTSPREFAVVACT